MNSIYEISPKLIDAMLLIIVLKQGINLTDTAEYIIIKFKALLNFGYQGRRHKKYTKQKTELIKLNYIFRYKAYK